MSQQYAEKLAAMIQKETISETGNPDKTKFYGFQELLRQLFPTVFSKCKVEDFNGSLLLTWKGEDSSREPVMFMNHFDVVEAPGVWKHEPFSGEIAEEKLWGRGTLDTKGGLFCMLQAAEELMLDGFIPGQDIYFESACTEEIDGSGAEAIAKELHERGIHFAMTLDEGGMILYDPIGGVDGTFAMIGVGEKSCNDLQFIAKGNGGHASMPGKDTPLVRLGKFMTAYEKKDLFERKLNPTTEEMFHRFSTKMKGPLGFVFHHAGFFKPLLCTVMPMVSPAAKAMLETTMAFTMAEGSDGSNVIPQSAHIVGNMRASHHEGNQRSIDKVRKLAEKYNLELKVLEEGLQSRVTDYRGRPFRFVEKTLLEIFPDISVAPYIMTGASDSKYFDIVCENCIRFTPFKIDDEQLGSIHGINENVNLDCLEPAVMFYKKLMKEYE